MPMHITTVGCFVHCGDEFVILHRHPDDTQGNKWGLPAGVIKSGESKSQTMIRKLKEELDLVVNESDLEFLGSWTWYFPEATITFPTFKIVLDKKIIMGLNLERHTNYKWITAKEYYSMSKDEVVHGIHDLLECAGYVDKKN